MSKPIVVLDPGHGGRKMIGGSSPNNARGANGLLERDLTLDMALRVGRELAKDADVRFTRDSDVNLSLADRAKVAKDLGAKVFVSIHFNGSDKSTVDGTEAWIGKAGHANRKALAQELISQVAYFAGISNRGVFTQDFGVIRGDRHHANTAACLLEVAFLSNPKQAAKLADSAYMGGLARAIATGIRGHLLGVCLKPPARAAAMQLVAQGAKHVNCPVLNSHASGDNLALRWTVPAEVPTSIDLVCHLHGFVGKDKPISLSNKEGMSGVNIERRDRLTLGLVPIGKKTGGVSRDGASDVVDFPAVLANDGLNKMIRWALDWYARDQLGNRVLGQLNVDRLLLTAHSGGGARLLKLLAAGHDPHELHLFDCLYEAPTAAANWAARHIATDAAMLGGISNENDWIPFMRSRGGALCCAWEGTGKWSDELKKAVDAAIAKVGNERIRTLLKRYYRVLRAGMGHNAIPAAWGLVLLQDATASPSSVKAGSHALDAPPDDLKQRLVDIALTEFDRWGKGKKKETAPEMSEALRDYWLTGTRTKVSEAEVRSASWQEGHPWSAAFISWVVRTAGGKQSFEYSAAHAAYIAAAKKAREAGDAGAFRAYRITEAMPELGDLVCKDRKICTKRNEKKACIKYECQGTTYDNVVRGKATHSDIVVEVDSANRRIRTIGGNVDSTVGEKWISLDANGRLPERASDGCRWIAILKAPGSPAISDAKDWAEPLEIKDPYYACLLDVKGMNKCPVVPPLCIRPRSASALPGSKAIRLPDIWNEAEPSPEGYNKRDKSLYDQLVAGNLPSFLRNFVPVTVKSPDGAHSITYHVMPDYLAVGSDDDYVTVPLGGPVAERLAEAYGCILPTPKMVWDIHSQAVHVTLEPRPYAGTKDARKQPSTWAYEEYSNAIKKSIGKALSAAGKSRGALVAGHRKDVVISDDLPLMRSKLVFYGGWLRNERTHKQTGVKTWHDILQGTEGGIKQLAGPHPAYYTDYSHGVRFVSRAVTVDGKQRDIGAVLKDPQLYKLLILEKPIDLNVARYNATGSRAQSLAYDWAA